MKHQIEAFFELLTRYKKIFSYFWQNRQSLETQKYSQAEAEFLPAALALQEKPISRTARYTALLLITALIFLFVWSFFSKLEIIVNASGRVISEERTKAIATTQNAIVKAIHVQEGSVVRLGDVLIELNAVESDSEFQKMLNRLVSFRVQLEKYRAFLNANENVQQNLPPRIVPNENFLSSLVLLLNNENLTRQPVADGSKDLLPPHARDLIHTVSLEESEVNTEKLLRRLIAKDPIKYELILNKTQMAYLINAITLGNQQIEQHHNMFRQKLAQYDAEILRDKKTLPVAKELATAYRVMYKNGDVSHHAYLEKEVAYRNLEGQLASMIAQRGVYVAQTKRDAWDAIIEIEKSILDTKSDANRFSSISSTLTLKAPVNGTVQQLNVHTVNGVAPAAQPLMLIAPESAGIEIEALVANKDIGFIQSGQAAFVKVDAFDYTKFGTIPAKVIWISADAILDEKKQASYAVKVVLDRNFVNVEGVQKKLTAGMTVSVEIKTGERRLVEYLLSPVVKIARESMNER
jgi:hemolysin D